MPSAEMAEPPTSFWRTDVSEERNLSCRLSRRALLQAVAAAGLASILDPQADVRGAPAARQRDLIRAENEKAGTTDWMLKNTRVDPKTKYRCPWIEGYCSHTSL